jgi:uncharacterized protein YecE (DUF72 family)
MEIYIGCSGYDYKDWRKVFYPENLPKHKWLEFYASHFNTVEINNTFYNFPKEENLKQWLEQTPDDFKFTIKANRYFSHMKKLKTDEQFLERLDAFQKILDTAKEKVACVLWQLPGNLHKSISKIKSFSRSLDRNMHHIIEFRHESWFDETVYEVLEKENLTHCILSAPKGIPEDPVITSKTAYVRFHGKSTWYDYLYSGNELEDWKRRIERFTGVERIFVYFNNDLHGNAVKNARHFKSILNIPVKEAH